MSYLERIRNHYRRLIHPAREHYEILDWAAAETQQIRFEVLRREVALDSRRLLDVGCGLGDLLGFLRRCGVTVDYTGVDITTELLELARRHYPSGRFVHADIFSDARALVGERFDVVFCSGTLNLNLGNNMEFLPRALDGMLRHTSGVLVINLLHDRVRAIDERYYHYNPDRVAALLRDRGCELRIVDDYLENDFTVVADSGRADARDWCLGED